jgi:hypothetical protein
MPTIAECVTTERTTAGAPLWAVLLTSRQRWLLERCTDWHARLHDDLELRAEFAELTGCIRNARPTEHGPA